MIDRINFTKIVVAHFSTLRKLNQKSKIIYWQDFLLFICLPFSLAFFFSYCNIGFKNQISNLIAAISILGGFLFNLLAIIYNSMENLKNDSKKSRIKQKFVKEIHSNISFNILSAIFSVILLIIYNTNINFWCLTKYWSKTLIFLNIYLISTFILTLLLVLNRVHILLNKNIEDE